MKFYVFFCKKRIIAEIKNRTNCFYKKEKHLGRFETAAIFERHRYLGGFNLQGLKPVKNE